LPSLTVFSHSQVGISYLLTSTVAMPLYGRFTDIFGLKPIFLFGIIVFLVGSIVSGAAQNMDMLISFRAVQGLGAYVLPINIYICNLFHNSS
jgi:MFS family permease